MLTLAILAKSNIWMLGKHSVVKTSVSIFISAVGRAWKTRPARSGWRNQYCLVWRRGGWEDLISLQQGSVGIFSSADNHRTQGNGLKLYWASLDQEWFLHGRGGQALKGAALGAGGVTIPTGIYKARECGTQGRGLAVDWDLMFLKAFFNLNASTTLFLYKLKAKVHESSAYTYVHVVYSKWKV